MSPVYQRKSLRRDLGRDYLRDTIVGNTALSLGLAATVVVMDSGQADPTASGSRIHERAWLRVGSADYRVSSGNYPSGAFVTQQLAPSGYGLGGTFDYEVHRKLSPSEKDRCLDYMVKRLRVRREVALPTIESALFYTMDAAASPHQIMDVLDVYVFADPTSSLDRLKTHLESNSDWNVVTTATGRELRLRSAFAASQQLVLDAVLLMTLGAADGATINLPDSMTDELILKGAAVQAYNVMIRDHPAAAGEYKTLRSEMVKAFNKTAARFAVFMDRPPRFEDPVQ